MVGVIGTGHDCSQCCMRAHCVSWLNNVFMHMAWYLHRTPEFRLVIILMSSPLALLVALRGMTDKVIAQREQYAAQVRTAFLSR